MTQSVNLALTEFLEVNNCLNATLRFSAGNEKSIGFKSYIKDLTDYHLLIDIPDSLDLESLLVPGEFISVEFRLGIDGLPPFNAMIERYQKDGIQGCWIQLPPEFKAHFLKRRRHIRINLKFQIKISMPVGQKASPPIYAESINLSGGGIRFKSSHTFKPNERLILEFQPDQRYPLFKMEGKVIACQSVPSKSGIITSVQFVNIQRMDEDKLVGLCFRKELEKSKHLKQE